MKSISLKAMLSLAVFVIGMVYMQPVEADSIEGTYQGLKEWKGDTISFDVLIEEIRTFDSVMNMHKKFYVKDFTVHMTATDSESGEIFIDDTWTYAVNEYMPDRRSAYGGASVVYHCTKKDERLAAHKRAKFRASVDVRYQ